MVTRATGGKHLACFHILCASPVFIFVFSMLLVCITEDWEWWAARQIATVRSVYAPYTCLWTCFLCGLVTLAVLRIVTVWIRGWYASVHELGHNVGMNHASTDTNNDGGDFLLLSSRNNASALLCTFDCPECHCRPSFLVVIEAEYGDGSCPMGGVGWLQFNVPHRYQLSWLNPASTELSPPRSSMVRTRFSTGTFALTPSCAVHRTIRYFVLRYYVLRGWARPVIMMALRTRSNFVPQLHIRVCSSGVPVLPSAAPPPPSSCQQITLTAGGSVTPYDTDLALVRVTRRGVQYWVSYRSVPPANFPTVNYDKNLGALSGFV